MLIVSGIVFRFPQQASVYKRRGTGGQTRHPRHPWCQVTTQKAGRQAGQLRRRQGLGNDSTSTKGNKSINLICSCSVIYMTKIIAVKWIMVNIVWFPTCVADVDMTDAPSPHRAPEPTLAAPSLQDALSPKPSARRNRLAALAQNINNWEDDLSHPTIT